VAVAHFFLVRPQCSRTNVKARNVKPPILNVFLSYTSREQEVSALQPVMDAYCDILLKWGRTRGIDIFYDHSSIAQDRSYSDRELFTILGDAIRRSHLLVSFLSPAYISSRWCQFEFKTKFGIAPRQIHKVYWKPEISLPLFEILSRLLHPRSTQFLLDVVQWDRIRWGDRECWRDTPWDFVEDLENPKNFSDLTDVYRRGFWAGPAPITRCAQKTAEILCREHPQLTGRFKDNVWFNERINSSFKRT
jgi:TIR domain